MSHIQSDIFVEQYALTQINARYKQGFCTVPALVTFLRNDYRELTLEQAVKTVNKWIDEYKIKHEHLAVAYNKVLEKKVVVLQSVLDKIRQRRNAK